MKQDWQHTSHILAMLHNTNVSKKSKAKKPKHFNPLEGISKEPNKTGYERFVKAAREKGLKVPFKGELK